MACSIKWALSYGQTNWSKVEYRVVSEFDIITQYFSSLGAGDFVALSVGDDAAALIVPTGSELIVSTDTAVCGTHFGEDLFPEDVAYKAVASAVSDLAAMGARTSQIHPGIRKANIRGFVTPRDELCFLPSSRAFALQKRRDPRRRTE